MIVATLFKVSCAAKIGHYTKTNIAELNYLIDIMFFKHWKLNQVFCSNFIQLSLAKGHRETNILQKEYGSSKRMS